MINKNLTLLLLCIHSFAFTQNIRNEKFGDIKNEDFKPASVLLTNDDAAVILSNVGSTEFIGNNSGYFTLIYKQHKKVLIRKKSAFDEATEKIYLHEGDYDTGETLDDFQAATYNLDNGKIITTNLNKDALIKEKFDNYRNIKKFTFPDVKEGSIIEYSYTLKSPFLLYLTPKSWIFQDKYPTLWSEYQVTTPPMFNYAVIKQGDYKTSTVIDSVRLVNKDYTILSPNRSGHSSDVLHFSGDGTWILWAMKNVPALKKESFVANESQNLVKYKFELHSIKLSNDWTEHFIKSWFETANDLLRATTFGKIFDTEENKWIDKEVEVVAKDLDDMDAAKKIYASVRDTYTCTSRDAIRFSDEPVKIFKTKKGNVADINLLLTAMLQRKGFEANPVILSTRGNGKISETTALLDAFDYVVCQVKVDSTLYYLDASDKKAGFGRLPLDCLNGYGRSVSKTPYLLDLSANTHKETKSTIIVIANAENDKQEASFESKLGYYESQDLRDKLVTTTTQNWVKECEKKYPMEVKIENLELDNQKNPDNPITVRYDIKTNWGSDDVVYFNPLLAEITKENIFKAEKRLYPVELPFAMDETYILNMEIPKGYRVDELPKSTRSKYNDDEGLFEYIITNKDGQIQLRCRFALFKANYNAEDYESLREFFGLMLKKQSEQIVFKKIK